MSLKVNVKLIGTAPYSPSKALVSERNGNEDWTEFSQRTWLEHLHLNSKQQVIMPIFGLKAMLDGTAKFLGMKVVGSGKRTYTKLFLAGIMLQGESPLLLVDGKPITKDEVVFEKYGEWVFCHSDGKRDGNASRVNRLFPKFSNWSCEFSVEAIDPRITKEVLDIHLVSAGKFNGMGRFSPRCGGCLGRFSVEIDGVAPKVDDAALIGEE